MVLVTLNSALDIDEMVGMQSVIALFMSGHERTIDLGPLVLKFHPGFVVNVNVPVLSCICGVFGRALQAISSVLLTVNVS